jgi:hypothetical protein
LAFTVQLYSCRKNFSNKVQEALIKNEKINSTNF